jgi:peptide/nickel transport system permease protein
MRPFLSHRLLLVFPTLIGATLLVFLLMRVLPGDVAYTLLAGDEGAAQVDPDSLALLRHQLGTDKPLHVQYLDWLAGIPRGDLGTSMWNRLPVAGEIARRLPLTIEIALLSVLLGFGAGLPLGIVSALKRNTLTDSIARFTSVLFLAIPSFWLGMLILMFTVHFYNWMPPLGYFLPWKQPGANITQILFPSLVIGSHIMAIITRITRSTMLEVLQEDYIRMARAKGFSERQIVMRHAMKNSMIPVITIASLSFGSLLGGTIIMERVFSVPGIGSYLIESITVRDYTATQALVLLFGGSFILINLLVDIAYGWLDPRISHP